VDFTGLHYNPILGSYSLGSNVDVNYLIAVKKPLL
jgi:2-polyprenyl-3-methyl-5-hydroxy-6-metoxy-1,4-benzoquinol methylase